MVRRSNTSNYPTRIISGIKQKLLFEKQLNEALRDEPKPHEYEFQWLSSSCFVLVVGALILEKMFIRSTNGTILTQDKGTESLLQPMRIAFHRGLNECYDNLVPVAYGARHKLNLTLLQRNGLF